MKPLPLEGDVEVSSGARMRVPAPAPRAPDTLPVYPVLLALSTVLSAVFCVLYLTKPVVHIVAAGNGAGAGPPAHATAVTEPADVAEPVAPVAPESPLLAADPSGLALARTPGPDPGFEETNLQVQHVLSVLSPDGELGRLVVDVPVLYQSRALHWDAGEVAAAATLLDQLRHYQRKTRELRAEGMVLLEAWQGLVARSMPVAALRADSPSLPANQPSERGGAAGGGRETAETIKLNTAATE